MSTHPELLRLRSQYERVVADYTAGHLDDATARNTLNAMWVFDAAGCAWGINLDGMFVRQRSPETPPEVVPPTLFAMVTTGGASRPGEAPWDQAAQAGVPFARPVVDPGPPGPSAVERLRGAASARRKDSAQNPGFVRRLVLDNRATVGVVTALLVLFVIALAGRSDTPSAAQPAVTVAGVVTTVTPGVPATGAVVVPSPEAVQVALVALGNRDATALRLGVKGSAQSALWAGLPTAGISVRVENVVATASGATADVILSGTDAVELGRISVSLVAVEGVWSVSVWPDVAAVIASK